MTRLGPEDKSFIGIAQRRTEVAVFLARLIEVALTTEAWRRYTQQGLSHAHLPFSSRLLDQ
jgi:hypothetical protein